MEADTLPKMHRPGLAQPQPAPSPPFETWAPFREGLQKKGEISIGGGQQKAISLYKKYMTKKYKKKLKYHLRYSYFLS